MRAWPSWLLGSVLFAVTGCSTTNPAGTAAYRAPGGSGGTGGARLGSDAPGSSEGTTDPGVRVFGAEPMGALGVETVPSVRPGSGAGAGPAAVPPAAPEYAAPPAPVRNAPRPPPRPPPPSRMPPEPAAYSGAHNPPPPLPPSLPPAVPASVEPPWPAQPYPAGTGTPPMPPRPRSQSDVLGTPPGGELPPPESRRVSR